MDTLQADLAAANDGHAVARLELQATTEGLYQAPEAATLAQAQLGGCEALSPTKLQGLPGPQALDQPFMWAVCCCACASPHSHQAKQSTSGSPATL